MHPVPSAQPPSVSAPVPRGRSVTVAVVVGLALAATVVATLLAGPATFFVFAGLLVMIAQLELYTVMRRAGSAPATLLGLVCGVVALAATYTYGVAGLVLGASLPVVVLAAWSQTVARPSATLAPTFLGIAYVPLLAGFCVLILRAPSGLVLVPAFIGITAVFDAGAYLVGRKLGRHKMSPRTSPNKSWEGYAGGVVVSVALAAVTLPWFKVLSIGQILALAAVLCVTTPAGDLAESLVKRDLGVKDMGTLIPGHGGVLDRLDAILFNAPVAFLVLRAFGKA